MHSCIAPSSTTWTIHRVRPVAKGSGRDRPSNVHVVAVPLWHDDKPSSRSLHIGRTKLQAEKGSRRWMYLSNRTRNKTWQEDGKQQRASCVGGSLLPPRLLASRIASRQLQVTPLLRTLVQGELRLQEEHGKSRRSLLGIETWVRRQRCCCAEGI